MLFCNAHCGIELGMCGMWLRGELFGILFCKAYYLEYVACCLEENKHLWHVVLQCTWGHKMCGMWLRYELFVACCSAALRVTCGLGKKTNCGMAGQWEGLLPESRDCLGSNCIFAAWHIFCNCNSLRHILAYFLRDKENSACKNMPWKSLFLLWYLALQCFFFFSLQKIIFLLKVSCYDVLLLFLVLLYFRPFWVIMNWLIVMLRNSSNVSFMTQRIGDLSNSFFFLEFSQHGNLILNWIIYISIA